MSEEIELDLSDAEVTSIIKRITIGFSKESKSYLEENGKTDDQIAALGQAVFNEHILECVELAIIKFDK